MTRSIKPHIHTLITPTKPLHNHHGPPIPHALEPAPQQRHVRVVRHVLARLVHEAAVAAGVEQVVGVGVEHGERAAVRVRGQRGGDVCVECGVEVVEEGDGGAVGGGLWGGAAVVVVGGGAGLCGGGEGGGGAGEEFVEEGGHGWRVRSLGFWLLVDDGNMWLM